MSAGTSAPSGSDELRLSELVAALSLGVDLGFGQPMEHVLRQCMIALRLAERLGLDEERAAAVYYTALLVNVGCHTDAHEQAKWFGDDIALKSAKYDHELRSCAGRRRLLRLIGAGSPPLHRLRIGLEFAVSGHREVDGMIEQHAALARAAGRASSGCPTRCRRRSASSYEQWDGRGWPGELAGERRADGVAAGPAGRVRRGRPPRRRCRRPPAALARKRAGGAVRPDARRRCCARDADEILDGLDAAPHLGRGDRAGAGARGRAVAATSSTPRCWRSPTSST